MFINAKTTLTVQLTEREFKVITKSLAHVPLSAEEKFAAAELNVIMMKQLKDFYQQQNEAAAKAEEKAIARVASLTLEGENHV